MRAKRCKTLFDCFLGKFNWLAFRMSIWSQSTHWSASERSSWLFWYRGNCLRVARKMMSRWRVGPTDVDNWKFLWTILRKGKFSLLKGRNKTTREPLMSLCTRQLPISQALSAALAKSKSTVHQPLRYSPKKSCLWARSCPKSQSPVLPQSDANY